MQKIEMEFLGGRMRQLREKNGVKSLEAMKNLLTSSGNRVDNRSTLSRAESGSFGEKTMLKWAEAYCNVFKYSDKQREQFLRGDKIALPDTSALLRKPALIDELSEEYNIVLIADIVLQELEDVKNSSKYHSSIRSHAKDIIKRVAVTGSTDRIEQISYSGDGSGSYEEKLIAIAKNATELYNCKVDIFTHDSNYTAIPNAICVINIQKYLFTKQGIMNKETFLDFENDYTGDYKKYIILEKNEINAFDDEGNTLIISTIYDKEHSLEERKNKIKWLIDHDALVDKRDCNEKYLPPISHAIINNDYEMFMFLLKECNANPNVACKNPNSTIEVRHKNEGNVPLMVAAWEGRVECLKALLSDERTSINQQDSNGFTALIKACANGEEECRDLLLDAGADTKIVDHYGRDYKEWFERFLDHGPLRDRFKSKNRKV